MKNAISTISFVLVLQTIGFAISINQTIYINSGNSTCIDGKQMSYKAFNSSPSFVNRNMQFSLSLGDSLFLQVINNDTIEHGFDVKWTQGSRDTVSAGDTINVVFSSSEQGLFIYYDHLNYPDNAYMGLSGIIAVGVNANTFFWNIKDHQLNWNDSIASGNTVDWMDYYPDYFTINGQSNPNINLDTTARVEGFVGDTILIFMANTGQAEHSIHFHGYHCDILYSSMNINHVGRNKDTFPIKRMEAYVLRLVPHQTGEYPVHDHNLLSITGGGIYPFGMFLTMLIQ